MTDIDLTQYPETVEAFDGNEQRAKVFLDRYAMKGPDGQPRETTPQFMWGRVARAIARVTEPGTFTEDSKRYFELLEDFKFVPGGRILAGAGTGTEVTFYNCYVIPVETKERRKSRGTLGMGEGLDTGNDSREAIIDTIGLMVDIMSRGGGVGINWSVLRPAGAHLKRINATSSGPVDWMHLASVAVGTVEQGGSRRGAAMFMLDDWHPDVLRFIDAKRDESRILNANISVAVSDALMDRVARDDTWTFGFPDTADPHYDAEWDGDANAWLDKGYGWVSGQTIKARELWRKLAEAAHASGEPGVVFLDRYNKASTGAGVERIISVNPCGEQGLGPYSVCNLGAMNLSAYVRPGVSGDSDMTFDFVRFGRDIESAVRFMDAVIDENHYFIPENEAVQKDLRRIGLGVMGLADALVKLGLRYGSPEAVTFTEKVFRFMKQFAVFMSASLAQEKGPAPAWRPEMLDRPYLQDLDRDVREDVETYGLRNLFLLTQAPTGTTSILAGVNSGIEPFFALGYWREDRTGRHWVQPKALEGLIDPTKWTNPDYVVTAGDVSVEEHIAMQAAVQKHVDSSVSKTINAPNGQTVDEVEKAYTLAYESGLKGLAYYRDGSRQVQVLRKDERASMDADIAELEREVERLTSVVRQYDIRMGEQQDRIETLLGEQMDARMAFERPDVLAGRTHKVRAGQQTAYVTVNRDSGHEPREVFVSVGKSGTDLMSMGEAMGRLISLGLQGGIDLLSIEDQLDGVGNAGILNRSLPSAIAAAIRADIAEAGRNMAVHVETPEGSIDGTLINWSKTDRVQLPVETEADEWADVVAAIPLDATHDLQTMRPFGPLDLCPGCGNQSLVREEGCQKCHGCGYSAC